MPPSTTAGRHFAVVTDSTSDITPAIAVQHDLTVIPMGVTIGAETFPDGKLTQAEFFARMRAAQHLPTTAQPSIDSLENLRRGGRIGAVASWLGSLLNIKVTIFVDPAGAFVPLGRVRGDTAALNNLVSWIATQMGDATRGRFAVGHAMSAPKAERLAEAIRERWPASELVMYEAGTVISTHAGTIWGAAFYPEG